MTETSESNTDDMQMQTFVASGVTTKGNGDAHLMPELNYALSCGGGQAGQGYPCVLTVAFSAGAGASAGSISCSEQFAPTLKDSASGNCMPSVLSMNSPTIYENHGMDARVTEFDDQSPAVTTRYGTGGGNIPLVQEDDVYCIVGNVIDRQPENGGNGLGCQKELSYTLTAMDRHCVYARQRVDEFRDDEIASTQSARQGKDATDLVLEPERQHAQLIRRLTPLECERLQGFPDDWTNIPGASDSARYCALGNSVAVPCVEFIMRSLVKVVEMEKAPTAFR